MIVSLADGGLQVNGARARLITALYSAVGKPMSRKTPVLEYVNSLPWISLLPPTWPSHLPVQILHDPIRRMWPVISPLPPG